MSRGCVCLRRVRVFFGGGLCGDVWYAAAVYGGERAAAVGGVGGGGAGGVPVHVMRRWCCGSGLADVVVCRVSHRAWSFVKESSLLDDAAPSCSRMPCSRRRFCCLNQDAMGVMGRLRVCVSMPKMRK